MSNPVPLRAFVGGVGIALASYDLLLLNGSVFGISGFIHRCYHGAVEPVFSVGGLVLGGVAIGALGSTVPPSILPIVNKLPIIAASGFLVGLGTKVCSKSRKMSPAQRLLTRSPICSYPTVVPPGEYPLPTSSRLGTKPNNSPSDTWFVACRASLRGMYSSTDMADHFPCQDLSAVLPGP
jgi:hypothetical protein